MTDEMPEFNDVPSQTQLDEIELEDLEVTDAEAADAVIGGVNPIDASGKGGG